MRAALALAAAIVAAVAGAPALEAYLKLGTQVNGNLVSLRWKQMPIRYFVTNTDAPGVTAPQLQQAIGRAFASWDSVPNVRLSSEFGGFTQAVPFQDDNLSVLGFVPRPDLERVLASTSFTLDTVTGDILQSDIFFNSNFPWSVAASGEPGRYDLESIAVHEIGHLHGLGHSALGESTLNAGGRNVIASEAIMFPIAFSPGSVNQRALRADDIAGISDLYGTDVFRQTTGSISGRVTKNGVGVLGAHIVAFNPTSGKLIGGFSLSSDGSFVITGLEPATQVLRAEPLDDADIGSFFDLSVNVDLNFRPSFSDQIVVVPAGGTATNIELKVVPK
jgi:matrixin